MADIQSAIRELRDQLFLDRADGKYLSNISSNLNFDRPLFGFSNDDLWRAIVRRCALDYRQIRNVFYDILTIIFGPKYTVATVLAQDTELLSTEVYVSDWDRIPQRGTIVVDEGLPTQETIEYTFRDPRNGKLTLKEGIQEAHTALLTNVTTSLKEAASATATLIKVFDSSDLPIIGYPYPILIDPGLDTEETVRVTNNDTVLNELTLEAPGLQFNHRGPTPSPIVTQLEEILSGNVAIRVVDSSQFGSDGMVWIQQDDGLTTTAESAIIQDNDTDSGTLFFKGALANTYSISSPTTTVNLLASGSSVQLAQVQVKGSTWDIRHIDNNKLMLYIPDELTDNRAWDVSHVHTAVLDPAPSFAIDPAASVGEDVLKAALGGIPSDFPTSGMATINDGAVNEERLVYTRNDAAHHTRLVNTTTDASILAGATTLTVDSTLFIEAFEEINQDKYLYLSRNNPTYAERVQYSSLNHTTNTVTLVSPTTLDHDGGQHVHPSYWPDTIHLTKALNRNHLLGETVDYYQIPWINTDLPDGRIFRSDDLYPGPYIIDPFMDAPREVSSQLAEKLAAPTKLMMTQIPGSGALEIRNGAYFKGTSAFKVRVKGGNASDETLGISSIVQRYTIAGIYLTSGYAPGATMVTVSDASQFPQSVITPYRYRMIIDRGGANEEVVMVTQISGNDVYLEDPLTKTHISNEFMDLMADVIVLSETNQYELPGYITRQTRYQTWPESLNPESYVANVSEIRTYFEIENPISNAIASAISPGVVNVPLLSTDDFPQAPPFYDVILGPGTLNEETVTVVSNDRTAAELTTSAPTVNSHPLAEPVEVDSFVRFPSLGDTVIVNFGRGKIPIDAFIASDTGPTPTVYVTLADSSVFPTTYPYMVEIGVGTAQAEYRNVLDNDTGTNTLMLDNVVDFPHAARERVRIWYGEIESVEYTTKLTSPNRLSFPSGHVFSSNHTEGEAIQLSGIQSLSVGNGSDYPFYLPSSWEERLYFLINKCRAAGVQILVTNKK